MPKALAWTKVLRTAVVITELKRVDRMLQEFRSALHSITLSMSLAFGTVTIEDILELIVGEIE